MTVIRREGYRKLVIYDPGTFRAVAMDVFLAPETLSTREETRTVGDGTHKVIRREHRLTVELSDVETIDYIEDWNDGETVVNALLLGFERHAQWSENVPLRLTPRRRGPGNLSGNALQLFSALKDAAVYQHYNLAKQGGWIDDGGDGVADGWTLAGEDSSAFAGKEQVIEASSDTDFERTIAFPAASEQVSGAADLVRDHSSGDVTLELEFLTEQALLDTQGFGLRDTDGNVINGISALSLQTNSSSAGSLGVTTTVPSNCKQITLRIKARNVTAGDTFAIKYPTLRTDSIQEIARY